MKIGIFIQGVNGTKGPIIKDSGGVSKIDPSVMNSASPIKNIAELATPRIFISPTDNSWFTTVKFILNHSLTGKCLIKVLMATMISFFIFLTIESFTSSVFSIDASFPS